MLTVRKPSPNLIRLFREAQVKLEFTYSGVGATANEESIPEGFNVDRTHVELGIGEDIFERARKALEAWQQFDLGWLQASPTDTPLRTGETIAIVARFAGLWWLNAARIVYEVDERSDKAWRLGFAYGTLPGHVEAGEERFLVEWDRTTDVVSYDILAFSRPRHFLTRIARRQLRRMQKRFGEQSAKAMQRAVKSC